MTKTPERTLVLIMITIIITLCTAWAATGIKKNTFPLRMNIFDEIFYDTRNNFKGLAKAGLKEIPGVTSPRYGGLLGEPVYEGPEYGYDDDRLPAGYEFISITFTFIDSEEKNFMVYFKKIINDTTSIIFHNTYDSKTRSLSISAAVRTAPGSEGRKEYTDPAAQEILAQQGITSADLDSYNEAILNDLVLADWTTVYHSRFSPDDYGNVEVTKQW